MLSGSVVRIMPWHDGMKAYLFTQQPLIMLRLVTDESAESMMLSDIQLSVSASNHATGLPETVSS